MQRKKKRHLDPRVWPSDCMQERAPTPGGKPSIIAGADERRAGWTGHGTLLGVTLRDRLPPACRWRAAPSYHDDVKKQVLCCIGAEGHSRRPPTRVPGASAAGRGGGRTPAKTHAAGGRAPPQRPDVCPLVADHFINRPPRLNSTRVSLHLHLVSIPFIAVLAVRCYPSPRHLSRSLRVAVAWASSSPTLGTLCCAPTAPTATATTSAFWPHRAEQTCLLVRLGPPRRRSPDSPRFRVLCGQGPTCEVLEPDSASSTAAVGGKTTSKAGSSREHILRLGITNASRIRHGMIHATAPKQPSYMPPSPQTLPGRPT